MLDLFNSGGVYMYLSKKLLENTVYENIGEDVVPLVKLLKNKKDVSEFKLASSLKSDINATRNKLYRLSSANLVSSIKRKDKHKGWYVYYWTLKPNRVKDLATKSKQQQLIILKNKLEREKENDFFICGGMCLRVDFEKASEIGFKCPECGNLLEKHDNKNYIVNIEKRIEELKKE